MASSKNNFTIVPLLIWCNIVFMYFGSGFHLSYIIILFISIVRGLFQTAFKQWWLGLFNEYFDLLARSSEFDIRYKQGIYSHASNKQTKILIATNTPNRNSAKQWALNSVHFWNSEVKTKQRMSVHTEKRRNVRTYILCMCALEIVRAYFLSEPSGSGNSGKKW